MPTRTFLSAVLICILLNLNFSNAQDRPNIVLIMADDVSWEAFSCYGAEDYETPNIDAMASKGVRFSHCYSTPICTTSRVKIMTGKYNFRNYTHFGYLNPSQKTFANLLQDNGYKTAIAGKWQLNGITNKLPGYQDSRRPYQAGFDEYMLWQLAKPKSVNAGGGERFWSPVLEHNEQLLTSSDNQDKYGPDMLCDFVCDFIEDSDDAPFLVYYPMVLVHSPFVPTPDTIGNGSRGHGMNKAKSGSSKENFVAMVQYMDKIVGRIVSKVEELGKAENTIILFTADNGTNTNITSRWNGRQIRGGKAGMTDMGTHVPLVAYWPGHSPVGKVDDSLIDFTDFYPTLAEAAGIDLGENDPTDGVSFLPQLTGQEGQPRNWVFCHYEPYWNKTPGQFVRNQTHKLYRDGRYFDIGSGDLEEKHNLAEAKTESADSQPTDSKPSNADTVRNEMAAVMATAPPTPKGSGNKDTKHRPTYPQWHLSPPND